VARDTPLGGAADPVRPSEKRPPRALKVPAGPGPLEEIPLASAGESVAGDDGFVFVDLHSPNGPELDAVARGFGLHPLAIEDVRHRRQRPKVDVYDHHYFLVLYRIRPDAEGRPIFEEVDLFIGRRFLVLVHDSLITILDDVVDRFARSDQPRSVSALLYALLDAIVDEYFGVLDALTERSEEVEAAVFQKFERSRLQNLLDLKKDLANFRRVVAPERDSVNVLLRRDPPILDTAHIFYFQDVYDHLIRISDSIDTDRELVTTSLDAFLSVENNRLSEIVRRLTMISTIFLPLNFVTGFFGMNFARLSGAGDALFAVALASMAVLPAVMLWLIRRQRVR
jgi:magnesium transporter